MTDKQKLEAIRQYLVSTQADIAEAANGDGIYCTDEGANVNWEETHQVFTAVMRAINRILQK